MKNLLKIISIIAVLFAIASCSEDNITGNEDSHSLKCTVTDECTSETAWADGNRYVNKGNWATYTQKPGSFPTCVDLLAGQDMLAGQVCFLDIPGDPDHLKIKIFLNKCWSYQDVNEPIKIQGYNGNVPSGNPAPGKFTTYKGKGEQGTSTLYVIVPVFDFYGIHLDVQNCCLEE
ncbi:MAG: hypothetical protein JW973_05815 [Bacteroidales bacterium]|nr:hypothetical protein [Bacteroidales bacterium]